MKLIRSKSILAGTLLSFNLLNGCGGVQEEAKVATTLQTLMVLSVEAAIRYNIDGVAAANTPLECSGGGTYTPSASLTSIVDFIQNGTGGAVSGTYSFSDCKLSLCGDSVTLNGSSEFELTPSTDVDGNRVMTLVVGSNATNQLQSAGIIADDEPEFEYEMSVQVSGSSLQGIDITGATTPYQYKGKVYKPSEIERLANGC